MADATDTSCQCLVPFLANLRSKQGANWTFVPFFRDDSLKRTIWIKQTLWLTSTTIILFSLIDVLCLALFLSPSLFFFFTSAKKSGFAGVLCGVWGGTIARKEVGATLLHGLAKGSAGPYSGAGPAALRDFHVFRTPVSKVRHQGAAHPFPIRLLQSKSSCIVSKFVFLWFSI